MRQRQRMWPAIGAIALTLTLAACAETPTSPAAPPEGPPADPPTANAYILPGAADLGATAFGDEPVVIHRGERLQWRNADRLDHNIAADTASLPEFTTTGLLEPGGARSFVMSTVGTTTIHCTIHPQMVGTLVVQDP